MPSDDAKAVKQSQAKREGVDGEEEEEKSLKSMMKAQKKNPTTNAPSSTSNSRPKASTKVKKMEPLDNDDEDFNEPLKASKGGSSGFRPRAPAAVKVKEEKSNAAEYDDDDDEDEKPISRKSSATKPDKELNKKRNKEGNKKAGSAAPEQNGNKRERKVYELPGQKREPPEERDPLRMFYESLHKQIPSSEMAQIWMMESGLLSKEEAKKVYEKKQKKNQLRLGSPAKAVSAAKISQSAKKAPPTPTPSTKKNTTDSKAASRPTKKRKIEDGSCGDDSDDDFLIKKAPKKQKAS